MQVGLRERRISGMASLAVLSFPYSTAYSGRPPGDRRSAQRTQAIAWAEGYRVVEFPNAVVVPAKNSLEGYSKNRYKKNMVELNNTKAEAFAERILTTLNNGALCLMLSLGHRTGLFDALRELPPSTPEEISQRAGLNQRYVRE